MIIKDGTNPESESLRFTCYRYYGFIDASKDIDFNKPIQQNIIDKLKTIEIHLHTAGSYKCLHCDSKYGSSEYNIPILNKNIIYVMPSLVIHYLEIGYQLPDDVINDILNFDNKDFKNVNAVLKNTATDFYKKEMEDLHQKIRSKYKTEEDYIKAQEKFKKSLLPPQFKISSHDNTQSLDSIIEDAKFAFITNNKIDKFLPYLVLNITESLYEGYKLETNNDGININCWFGMQKNTFNNLDILINSPDIRYIIKESLVLINAKELLL